MLTLSRRVLVADVGLMSAEFVAEEPERTPGRSLVGGKKKEGRITFSAIGKVSQTGGVIRYTCLFGYFCGTVY